MDLRKIIAVFVFAALIALTTLIAFAAEEVAVGVENPAASPVESVAAVSAPQTPSQNENDTQWIWGEVTSLDSAGKIVTLKYLDYETDQEKDIILTVDEKTTFENIGSFDEIKVKDTLSIDYVVGSDGKNVAKNIGRESPDSSAAVPAQAVEDTKQDNVQASPEEPVASPDAAVEQALSPEGATSDSVTQK
ncbi:MAG: hypothetical protein WC357_05570 [Candidatus Omnitrophota bacterium]|jgi:hypothetical protein